MIHTADNHIGMKFNSRYSPDISLELTQERLEALKRIVQKANDINGHFIVITGDLFDSISVPQKDIKAVADILATFNGDVIIIPGNHDFYEDHTSKLWSAFLNFSKSNIHLLKDFQPCEFFVDEQKVTFYPAGCNSKYSEKNLIGWTKDIIKEGESLNIGLAHGNVEGLGLDYEDKYFNMTPSELNQCEMDCWLLGHIHVPYPSKNSIEEKFFFSGTHTPDGFDYLRDGGCWLLEFENKKLINTKQWAIGALKFYDKSYFMNSELDIEKFEKELAPMVKDKSLIKINLKGSLTEYEKNILFQKLKGFEEQFLYMHINEEIIIKLQKEQIDSLYTNNSLPHKLLTLLSNSKENEMALQLAHQLIEEVKQ